MTPRNPAHIGPDGKGFFGTVTVGRRGQVALPAQARKQLGLEPGDQLVVLERAPNDPLAMLVRSTLGGSAPTGPPPGGPGAAPPGAAPPGAGPAGAPPSAPPAATASAPPSAPSAPPAAGPATAYPPPAPPTTSAPTHQEQS